METSNNADKDSTLSSSPFKEYEEDIALCSYETFKEYIKATESIRKNEQRLFTSIKKPHKVVARDTIQ